MSSTLYPPDFKSLLSEIKTTKDEFLSVASHELRTPLTSLKLQLQMAKRELNNELKTPQTNGLNSALQLSLKQVGSLENLIDEMIDFIAIQSGDLLLTLEDTDLTKTVRKAIQRVGSDKENRFTHKDFSLNLKENIVGFWDRRRIEQVVMNIVSNIKNAEPGRSINVILFGDGLNAVLTFSNLPARHISGLGLGLFLVKKIVEAHRGDVEWEVTEDSSWFKITLPISPTVIDAHPFFKKTGSVK